MEKLFDTGGTIMGVVGLLSLIVAIFVKRSQIKLNEATYTQIVQATYKGLAEDLNRKIADLENQVTMLLDIVNGYKENCAKCVNNDKNKTIPKRQQPNPGRGNRKKDYR